MELYDRTSSQIARLVTNNYSTSFSLACRLFPYGMRTQIYNIYGLVRIADETVDTYRGVDQREQLDALEAEVYNAIKRGYSANPIVHAFARTVTDSKIDEGLIQSFFVSMRADTQNRRLNESELAEYIYGSAEVVGLMCLAVFTSGDEAEYVRLKPGAQALGAAFQKVNFLRDLAADHGELGRIYFPQIEWRVFDDTTKRLLEDDIAADFEQARLAIAQLPPPARSAVAVAWSYYNALLRQIQVTPAEVLKHRRVRVSNFYKLAIFLRVGIIGKLTLWGKS